MWRPGPTPEPVRQFPVYDLAGEVIAVADLGFPPVPFVVETDGLETHRTREQQQYDINRQNRIHDAGYELRRFTYTDVTRRARHVRRQTARGLVMAMKSSRRAAIGKLRVPPQGFEP